MIEYENLRKVNEPFFHEFRRVFKETLESGWYILGQNVDRFEREFADYCGASHCVGVASGLDALILSLKAFDFPREVRSSSPPTPILPPSWPFCRLD